MTGADPSRAGSTYTIEPRFRDRDVGFNLSSLCTYIKGLLFYRISIVRSRKRVTCNKINCSKPMQHLNHEDEVQ